MTESADENYDIGFEISLTPRSEEEDLENRYDETCSWTNTSSTVAPVDKQGTKKTWPRRKAEDEELPTINEKPSRGEGYRRRIHLLLCCCLVGMIVAAILGAKQLNKGKAANNAILLSKSVAGDNVPTPAPHQGSMIPSGIGKQPGDQTPSPTGKNMLSTHVRSVKSRYSWGENITVSFSFGNDAVPEPTDWIGIYPADADPSNLGTALMFRFLCDKTTLCNEAVPVGHVTFSESGGVSSQLANWTWPLDIGNNNAFILRGFQAPFQVIAESSTSF